MTSGGRAYDAVIVGGGPNGLAAALTLSEAGRSVAIFEATDRLGGGARTESLGFPSVRHDLCSSVHPLAYASPFFESLGLRDSISWIHPPAAVAHPLEDGRAAMLWPSLDRTATGLGWDAQAWCDLFEPFVTRAQTLLADVLQPPLHVPRSPALMARFALRALLAATATARRFRTPAARALLAGLAGHSAIPLDMPGSSAIALVLGVVGQRTGWPFPRGGAQQITDVLARRLGESGVDVFTSRRVRHLSDLPRSRTVFFAVDTRQVAAILRESLPSAYAARLRRFRYGPGAFKVDYVLDRPTPWRARDCALASTVHLGGAFRSIASSERRAWRGSAPVWPFLIVFQPSLFDPARAPGRHVLAAYCHVPAAWKGDATGAIEAVLEHHAPGFLDCVLHHHVSSPESLERDNAALVGGDITGGANTLAQVLLRPVPAIAPYRLPARGMFLCSASSPPGGGVHGMPGHLAAQAALRKELR